MKAHLLSAASGLTIWLIALASAAVVQSVFLSLQWVVYAGILHNGQPMRLSDSSLAAALAFLVVLRWQYAARRRRLELLLRVEAIRWMNDRIRNALQAIELVAFENCGAAQSVRTAVDAVENVLQEVLASTQETAPFRPATRACTASGEGEHRFQAHQPSEPLLTRQMRG